DGCLVVREFKKPIEPAIQIVLECKLRIVHSRWSKDEPASSVSRCVSVFLRISAALCSERQERNHREHRVAQRKTSKGKRLVIAQLVEQFGIDVAAADHSDVDICVGQLVGMEKKCGYGYSTTRFGQCFRVRA